MIFYEEIYVTIRDMYSEIDDLLADREMNSVVQHGLNAMYGPPIYNPDIALITFQGGGSDCHIQKHPPERLLYLSDSYNFGCNLRKYMREAGMYEILESKTVAHSAVFPQAPTNEANSWLKEKGAKRKWLEFSIKWNKLLIEKQNPKIIIFFGEKASSAFGVKWNNIERNHKQNHMTYAISQFMGKPSIYCHHLSQGAPKKESINCFLKAKEIINNS